MSIKLSELLKGASFQDQSAMVKANLLDLTEKLGKLRQLYGKPLIITSGLRTKQDHERIYAAKGIPASKIPWGSQHLSGGAADVSDPKGLLAEWCLKNVKVLEELGLWCEDFKATAGWCHFQLQPPKSGKRFFMP